nr:Os03g0706650 [Ipomoea batatas]
MFRNLFRKICQFPDSFMQRNNDEDITTGNVPLRQRPNIFLFQKFYLLYNTDEQVAGFEENCLVFSLVLSLALALAFSLDSLAVFSSFFELSSMADFIISPSVLDDEAPLLLLCFLESSLIALLELENSHSMVLLALSKPNISCKSKNLRAICTDNLILRSLTPCAVLILLCLSFFPAEEASVSAAAVGDDDEKIFEIAADRREMGKGSIRREDRHLLV